MTELFFFFFLRWTLKVRTYLCPQDLWYILTIKPEASLEKRNFMLSRNCESVRAFQQNGQWIFWNRIQSVGSLRRVVPLGCFSSRTFSDFSLDWGTSISQYFFIVPVSSPVMDHYASLNTLVNLLVTLLYHLEIKWNCLKRSCNQI